MIVNCVYSNHHRHYEVEKASGYDKADPTYFLQTNHVISSGINARNFTLHALTKVMDPVLTHFARGTLRSSIGSSYHKSREALSSLEAFARGFCGLAAWLELEDPAESNTEGEYLLRQRYRTLTLHGIKNALNPESADFFNFTISTQCLVESAYLSLGFLRAPKSIWSKLGSTDQKRMIDSIASYRNWNVHNGLNNNWSLFVSVIEAFLFRFAPSGIGNLNHLMRGVDLHMEQFYKGDGTYGDGPSYRWDYYNSYVIQPMLLESLHQLVMLKNQQPPMNRNLSQTLELDKQLSRRIDRFYTLEVNRAKRWAEVQEMMISPEGTYPIYGRTSSCRMGAFQGLSMMIHRKELPNKLQLHLGGVRSAITTVLYNYIVRGAIFDADGWLVEGILAFQPKMAEGYVSRGSLYHFTTGLLHLGLPRNDPFWTASSGPWTQQRIWSGNATVASDHASD